MIEIFQILLLYIIFSFTIFTPINIFSKNNSFVRFESIEISSFNLAINLSFLLLLSIINIPLVKIQIYILFYIFIFFYITKFKKFLIQFNVTILIIFIISKCSYSLKLVGCKVFYYIKSLYFYEGKT